MSNTQIVRLYTRVASGVVADTTLDPTKNAEVVMEVEAGATDFNMGASFKAGLAIVDLEAEPPLSLKIHATTNVDPLNPNAPYTGSMASAPWTNPEQVFIYNISAADLAPHAGHVCKAYGYLTVGAGNREAYVAESPLFIIIA